MHYYVPKTDLHLHFADGLETKPSGVKKSRTCPNKDPGQGLYTTKARAANDFLCAFPGYWMEEHLFEARGEGYAFSIPKDKAWGPMHNLLYATHPCNANFINAAVVGDEVL